MIKIIEPEKQYKPKNGDVLWGAASDWAKPDDPNWESKPEYKERLFGLRLNVLDGTEYDNQLLLMAHVSPNPINAIKILGIDPDFMCPYKDPYTGYQALSICPTAILSDDVSKYRPACEALDDRGCRHVQFPDLAFDIAFVKDQYGGHKTKPRHNAPEIDEIFSLTRIQELMMGTGYTYGCSMNDGGHSCLPAKMKLDNGDWLFVWFWEWYNK